MDFEVELKGGAPWGFRIQGGKEFHSAIKITFVSFKHSRFVSIVQFILLFICAVAGTIFWDETLEHLT